MLDLFSGAGGAAYFAKLKGFTTIGYVENDEYCQKVIKQRIEDGIFNDAPIFSDVRTFDGRPYCGKVDLITGGFPCQPFSVAGKRAGQGDSRNLWPDTIRIIREVRPKQCFLENVPGLLSSGYFGKILSNLSESGFNAKWKVLSAAEVGAPHYRFRLWIYAETTNAHSFRGRVKSQSKLKENKTNFKHYGQKKDVSNSECKGLEGQQLPLREKKKITATGSSCWWAVEPNVGRVVHGLANRKHRIKALGNGWVPQVASTAWEILTAK